MCVCAFWLNMCLKQSLVMANTNDRKEEKEGGHPVLAILAGVLCLEDMKATESEERRLKDGMTSQAGS